MNLAALKTFSIDELLSARALVLLALNNPKKATPVPQETLDNWRLSIRNIEGEIASRPAEMLQYILEIEDE